MTSFVSKACYRISVYEKSTEKLAWLLGFRAFRELLDIEQHRGVTVREHEVVTVGPEGVVGIEAQEALPETVVHRRERHGRAGMPRLRMLHGVH